MARSLKARVERAEAVKEAACDAIYAAGRPLDLRFSECRALSSAEARAVYDLACDALYAVEAEAIAKGKAWRREAGSLLFWN